jgi:hypothetical protein
MMERIQWMRTKLNFKDGDNSLFWKRMLKLKPELNSMPIETSKSNKRSQKTMNMMNLDQFRFQLLNPSG